MRRPRLHGMPLALAITLALVVKFLILFWLWKLFFSMPPAKHMHMPTPQVEQHLLGTLSHPNHVKVHHG